MKKITQKIALGLLMGLSVWIVGTAVEIISTPQVQTVSAQGLAPQNLPTLQNDTKVKSVKDLADFVINTINTLITFIIGLAVFFFVYGLVKYVASGSDPKKITEARDYIIYGIIGIAVMVSVWGLVRIVVSTFFPTTGSSFTIPQFKS